jgi:squalene-associated FAD-dependent desaturase
VSHPGGAARGAAGEVSADAAPSAGDTRVCVIGGGLAGIAAALRCADAGASVTLLEVRPRLGGAAYSVQREGLTIDNGQHVFLRCCTAYRALLERLGSSHLTRIQDRLEIPTLRAGGGCAALRRSDLPTPLHLVGTLLRHSPLSRRERVFAAIAAAALGRLDPDDPALDSQTLGDWLARHRQSEQAIDALWDLIALPTLNVRAREASLALGAFVFQRGFLSSADASDIGFHEAPLSAILGEPALPMLAQAGVQVRLGCRVSSIASRDGGFEVTASGGPEPQALRCEAAIVALPHLRAAELLPPQAGEIAARMRQIGVSPIVNLHVLYDRRVCEPSFAAGVESPLQYVFDRTQAGGAPAGSQYLAVSLSAASTEMAMSVQELRERYLPELQRLLPHAKHAKVQRFLVTREHAATFRAAPGVGALRPGPRTPLPGLALAGAYTATGWPATLEGAVISGHAAAEAVLGDLAGVAEPVAAGVA